MAKKKQLAKRRDLPRSQIGAIPLRPDDSGAPQIMLITSRETRRWIIPKGWPMKGRKDFDAAAQEAYEEAGVVGRVQREPLGTYLYWKRQGTNYELCDVKVYRLDVDRQLEDWPERHQREARWFSLQEAATRVEEPGLREIIQRLAPAQH